MDSSDEAPPDPKRHQKPPAELLAGHQAEAELLVELPVMPPVAHHLNIAPISPKPKNDPRRKRKVPADYDSCSPLPLDPPSPPDRIIICTYIYGSTLP